MASTAMGRPSVFVAAVACVVMWGVTGPVFHFSDAWQLSINTGTTIITFLMVFLIQHTQNRQGDAVQIKLDELIRAVQGAHNYLVSLEDATDQELAELKTRYRKLHEMARIARARGSDDTGRAEPEED
jgi:low affinity Fe/Cu permease